MTKPIHHNKANSTFDNINAAKSATIYKLLTQGKVILKKNYDEIQDKIIDSPLFTLIFNNPSHFDNLYQHIGYQLELHNQGNFYYIKELTEDSTHEADGNAFKIQVILLLIGRYFSRSGRNLELLANPDSGLNENDIEALENDEESSDILRTAHFSKGWHDALKFLCKRSFAFETSSTSLFLSDAGMAFLNRLIAEYEQDTSSN